MDKRNKAAKFMFILLIPVVFTFAFIITSGFPQQGKKIGEKLVVQKKSTLEIKKSQKIHPADIDPAEAAAAGYQETSTVGDKETRIYRAETGFGRSFIFSEVEGSLPPNNLGYFRVLDRYGYGKKEENVRNHLIFGTRTEMPGLKNPLRVLGSYVFLFFGDSIDLFAVYYDGPYESRGLFFLRAWVPEDQEIKDLDGDGRPEFQAVLSSLRHPISLETAGVGKVLVIYRFVPSSEKYGCARFITLKGRPYEEILLGHAKKMKEEKKTFAWLAAIESTENPKLIKQAMDEFWGLPFLRDENKKKIVELLIKNGFTGITPYDRNPR